ncbi:HD domain-containing protein [Puniceicoccales bacterium CK1056]|uniref:HD domain-containing protein n=1 Tax=Oceanipulchritudo coccoides TaxID=2706888 RepID=A0A6B2M5X7_9BACT|nr:HD domain-containing protein [Oceanipulchritudo coccoides]NDV63504.1 HD domain-containing protein [Oceanipulchritudo coccoides]
MKDLTRHYTQSHWSFLMRLARLCADAGGKAYLVGGCVRSALLGEEVLDFDVEVFQLEPDILESLLRELAPFTKVGKAFGIYKLSGWPVDVGLPRRESKRGSGHRGFDISIDPGMSLEEAAMRRDFTVNAIYFDMLEEGLIDPLGGLADLEAKRLRHCSERFSEDPLRVLRAMQFAARIPATVCRETTDLCKNLTPEGLSPERYFAEWEKLLLEGKSPSAGLHFLEECRWLQYFPELAAMSGCPQDPEWHPEGDVYEHTLHCLDAFARERSGNREEDLIVGFAVLCHDMGKPSTTKLIDGHLRSYGHETAGLKPARAFMKRLNLATKLAEQVLPLIKCHMRPAILFQEKSSPSAIRRLSRDCGRLDLLLRVFRADSAGRPPIPDNSHEANDWLLAQARQLKVTSTRPKPLLNGHDLMKRGWTPGPHMGRFLDNAYERQLDGAFTTRADALEWLEDQRPSEDQFKENQSDRLKE